MHKKSNIIEPIRVTFDEVVAAVATKITKAPRVDFMPGENFLVVQYGIHGEADAVHFLLEPRCESIWVTQAQIVDLFAIAQRNVSYYLNNVFSEGELDGKSNTKKVGISRSAKPMTVYSLDALISVGYRLNSKKVLRFHHWTTQIIKALIEEAKS